MKAGDVVLASLPQADGQRKIRPALLLSQMPPFRDWLVCGISSQVRHEVADFDEVIRRTDSDFVSSGLLGESLIRLGFLGMLPEGEVAGTLGHVDDARLQRLRKGLARHLDPDRGEPA